MSFDSLIYLFWSESCRNLSNGQMEMDSCNSIGEVLLGKLRYKGQVILGPSV